MLDMHSALLQRGMGFGKNIPRKSLLCGVPAPLLFGGVRGTPGSNSE